MLLDDQGAGLQEGIDLDLEEQEQNSYLDEAPVAVAGVAR